MVHFALISHATIPGLVSIPTTQFISRPDHVQDQTCLLAHTATSLIAPHAMNLADVFPKYFPNKHPCSQEQACSPTATSHTIQTVYHIFIFFMFIQRKRIDYVYSGRYHQHLAFDVQVS